MMKLFLTRKESEELIKLGLPRSWATTGIIYYDINSNPVDESDVVPYPLAEDTPDDTSYTDRDEYSITEYYSQIGLDPDGFDEKAPVFSLTDLMTILPKMNLSLNISFSNVNNNFVVLYTSLTILKVKHKYLINCLYEILKYLLQNTDYFSKENLKTIQFHI